MKEEGKGGPAAAGQGSVPQSGEEEKHDEMGEAEEGKEGSAAGGQGSVPQSGVEKPRRTRSDVQALLRRTRKQRRVQEKKRGVQEEPAAEEPAAEEPSASAAAGGAPPKKARRAKGSSAAGTSTAEDGAKEPEPVLLKTWMKQNEPWMMTEMPEGLPMPVLQPTVLSDLAEFRDFREELLLTPVLIDHTCGLSGALLDEKTVGGANLILQVDGAMKKNMQAERFVDSVHARSIPDIAEVVEKNLVQFFPNLGRDRCYLNPSEVSEEDQRCCAMLCVRERPGGVKREMNS